MSNTQTCPNHPNSGGIFVATPMLTHYGKMVCPTCERFLYWVAKPEGEKRRNESQKLAKMFERVGIDYCQMCLRQRDELPANVTLTVHHVTEDRDGGSNEPSNTWRLCTICHEMVHLMRRNRANPQDRPMEVPVWEMA